MLPDLGLVQLFLISGLVRAATSEYVVCPDSSQWGLRTRAFCNSTHPSLNCLYEETTSTFIQFCTTRPDFQRPGYKFIIRGNIDGMECEKNRFQPIKFWTNGSSDCILEKTRCDEPGQVIHVESDSTSDRTCRCDYTKGFAFISQRQNCFCDPSLEDCSCFLKPCRKYQVMTPDYNCIDAKDWTGIFKCPVIRKKMATNVTTRCPVEPADIFVSPKVAMIDRKFNALIVTVLSVPTVIIIIISITCGLKIEECCRNLNMTDEGLINRLKKMRPNEINTNVNMTDEKLDERLNKMKEHILHDLTQMKVHAANYKDIITRINTKEILDKLTSITDSEKTSIDVCFGRRQKNKALMEIVWNRRPSYVEFMKAIRETHSNVNLANKIEKCTDLRDVYHETIQKDGKDFLEKLEENLYNKKIPEEVRNDFNRHFESWYKDDEKFTVTEATGKIERALNMNHCVLVIGRSGNGKSAIIRHLALRLFNEDGYDIVPIDLDFSTILQYHDPERKQLFVLDDFCGKVNKNTKSVKMGSVKMYDVLKLIKKDLINTQNTLGQGKVKMLFATQPFVYEQSSFNRDDCLSKYKVYLSDYPLQNHEKIQMITKYLPKCPEGPLPDMSKHYEDIFPLMCKLSEGKTTIEAIELFKDPANIIKKDFHLLKKTNKKQICLIALCVLFKSLTKDMFNKDNTPEKKEIIEVICSDFDLDFSDTTTRLKLKDELTNLEKKVFVKSGDVFYFAHKAIYNIAAVSCGEIFINSFIRFAYSSFIAERYSFVSSSTEGRETHIYIRDEDTKRRYFDRLMNDLEQGITYSTFHNCQLIDESYRELFCSYCNGRKTNLVKILNRLQNLTTEPPLNNPIVSRKESINDYEDYIDFSKSWHFSSHNMKIPLIESAWEGHDEIVKMLIDLDRNVNETDKFGRSALYVACYRGKKDVVQRLIEEKANQPICEANEKSPLYAACKEGHTQIVNILLKKKPLQLNATKMCILHYMRLVQKVI